MMEVILNLHDKPDFNQIVVALESRNHGVNNLCMGNNTALTSINDFSMRIIKSDLGWLSEIEKDIVYDMASKCIAEKCGRTAMPEMRRKWTIPATDLHPTIEILLREPSLTGDNLGLKTWATSFSVSKKIGQVGRDYFLHLLSPINSLKNCIHLNTLQSKIRVLELGSGTGLLGIVAAAVWGVPVLSTDLEDVQENLCYNIQLNYDAISRVSGGSVSSKVLDWRIPEKAFSELREFELIMATDPLYDEFHPLAFARTVNLFLKKNSDSRLLVAIPLRDKYTFQLSQDLKRQLLLRQFQIVSVDLELSQDNDWAGSRNNSDSFHIETTIWRRSEVDTKGD
ncbi:putative glucose-inducible sam-dependent methyltransferase rrg1 [Erysiphe necator]|uniref:Putative glucose-inducible sam-dependent methyltransferase rrg1 n=1 Tax=Uncinula necator TaxID=52586 RepID=A0A0B1P6A2_UNCNE|nr:putative glucose-inducible sam-dependent methyltransferase rrg1 [Erysiphe necator]